MNITKQGRIQKFVLGGAEIIDYLNNFNKHARVYINPKRA